MINYFVGYMPSTLLKCHEELLFCIKGLHVNYTVSIMTVNPMPTGSRSQNNQLLLQRILSVHEKQETF